MSRIKQAGLAVLGIVLLVRGLRKRSVWGILQSLVGGFLLYRALGGQRSQGLSTGMLPGRERGEEGGSGTTTVSRTVTIGEPAAELYESWRDADTFSQVMGHFADVTAAGEDTFRWTVEGPLERDISWETRVVGSEPEEYIRWETPDDAIVPNEGRVEFEELAEDRGTAVTLSVQFDPPGGAVGNATLNRLDMAPAVLVGDALGRFKSLVESGEIPTLDGNPSARGKGDMV